MGRESCQEESIKPSPLKYNEDSGTPRWSQTVIANIKNFIKAQVEEPLSWEQSRRRKRRRRRGSRMRRRRRRKATR